MVGEVEKGHQNVECRSGPGEDNVKDITHVMGWRKLVEVQSKRRRARMLQLCSLSFGRSNSSERNREMSSGNELRRKSSSLMNQ